MILFQCIEQLRGEAEVSFHEIFWIFRPIHPRQIEYEIRPLAVGIQLFRSRRSIVLIDFLDMKGRPRPVLPVTDIFEVVDQRRADHAFGTCHKDIHGCITLFCIGGLSSFVCCPQTTNI